MRRFVQVCAVLFLFMALVFACAGGEDFGPGGGYGDGEPDGGTYWECYSANDCPAGNYCNEFHRCVSGGADGDGDVDGDGDADGDPWIPPEVEYEFGAPSGGYRYVYVALTNLDTIARVDSETLDVASIPVGDIPSHLATVQGEDVAVVLNVGSSTVSILRTTGGVDDVVSLPTPPRLNRLVLSPLGSSAIAYFELVDPRADDIGSFQDLAVIRLDEGEEEVINVSVGFRPRRVIFSEDDRFAYVITEDGVSTVDLDAAVEGYVAPTVPVTLNPFEEGRPTEVIVASDGSYAFARWDGLSLVRSIDLETGEIVDTPLPGVPTDIDLSETGEQLVAVVRETSQVAMIEVPHGIGDPESIRLVECAPLTVGSAVLIPGSSQILVFTNATNQEAIALVDLETGDVQATLLRKAVRAVAISPDGRNALVMHSRLPGEPLATDDFETQFDKRPGFSLISLETMFVKLQLTEADAGSFTFFPDGSSAYVIVADRAGSLREIDRIDLDSFLVTPLNVGSHPVEIGNVPGTHRVYVSQDHPMGRLSFIDVRSGEVRTVTGFELNSQIIE